MEILDELVKKMAPHLKEMGYRKNGLNWYKDMGEHSLIFSIQKSQYDRDAWYYNFGISLHDLTDRKPVTGSACQIQYRTDAVVSGARLSAEHLSGLVASWERRYGDMRLLRRCAVEGKLPGVVDRKAIRYLSSVDVTAL